MTPEASKSKTAVTQNEREELLEATLLTAPELTFTSRGDPAPPPRSTCPPARQANGTSELRGASEKAGVKRLPRHSET